MIEKITLENGVRIVFERIAHVRSVSLGIWVGTGSRFERAAESGASHFIEHMLFKGTHTRTAAQIAAETDMLGGQMNAFTSKENTCFYCRVLDSHLPLATDILCDMFFESRFDEEDVASERRVILEEIGMYDDAPDDLVMERLSAAVYKGSSLARPILGREKQLNTFTGEFLRAYKEANYRPDRIVVSLCGSFTDEDVERLRERFSAMQPVKPRRLTRAHYTPAVTTRRRKIEQNNLVLAFPGLPGGHADRYKMQLLNSVLGSGSSSRLFQAVREQRGLCYSVYSFVSGFSDTGLFGVYTATGSATEREALELILGELRRFRDEGVSAAELDRCREQIKANILMSLESTGSRMNSMGRNTLLYDRVPDPEETVANYDAVSAEDIRELAERIFDPAQASVSAVGRVMNADEYRKIVEAIL